MSIGVYINESKGLICDSLIKSTPLSIFLLLFGISSIIYFVNGLTIKSFNLAQLLFTNAVVFSCKGGFLVCFKFYFFFEVILKSNFFGGFFSFEIYKLVRIFIFIFLLVHILFTLFFRLIFYYLCFDFAECRSMFLLFLYKDLTF